MKAIAVRLILCFAMLLPVLSLAQGQTNALPEELQALVDEAGDFDGFTLLTADADTLQGNPKGLSVFVLSKEDCCVLFVAKELEDGWKLDGFTRKNLYPDRKQNENLKLYIIDSESFRAGWPGADYYFYAGSATYYSWLYRAEFDVGGSVCTAIREPDASGLWFDCDDIAVYWELTPFKQITYRNCNPMLFPTDVESVGRINSLLSALSGNHFEEIKCKTSELEKDVKIYMAPDENSAQVDRLALFQQEYFFYHGNIGEWHLISYQNGIDHEYFGYIKKQDFPLTDRELDITQCHLDAVRLVTRKDTWLTNDPDLSQERYMTIPSGAAVTGLSGWDASYIYAEVNVGGESIRGFIPMLDLELCQ